MKLNCSCIKDLQKKLTKEYGYENVSPEEVNLFNGVTFTYFSYNKPGKKREQKVVVIHSFCPWCGKTYDTN